MHGPTDMWNLDIAIDDDGEWITWDEINSHLDRLEFKARFANLDVDLVPVFHSMLTVAQDYHQLTGIPEPPCIRLGRTGRKPSPERGRRDRSRT